MKEEDIALACGTPKATSADGQKHDLFDVIKNVFESASEGKGIEEIIKSFKKM